MERLTKRIDEHHLCIEVCEEACIEGNTFCPKCKPFTAVLKKLMEYEDLEEQGLLMKLPCKVGDKLYDVRQGNIQHRINNMVHELEVCCISVKFVPWETWCASDVPLNEIGKTVFLTKAEAEKALAEMEK